MSCLASALVACQTLQSDLTSYFNSCNHAAIREPMPFAEFVASDMNNMGLRNVIAPGNGKVRTVELTYVSRIPESDVSENVSDLCSCSRTKGNCSQVYTIDPSANVSTCEKIKASDLRNICQSNSSLFAQMMALRMDALERKIATIITQQAVFLTGKWANDVTPVNAQNEFVINTLKAGDPQTLNPLAFQAIDLALMKTGYCAPPAIFAGDTLFNYYRSMLTGCCATSGIDLSQQMNQYGKAVMWDRRVSTAFGSTHAIVTQPGALALLWWNEFGWADGVALPIEQGSNYVRTLAISPRLNIPVDIIIKDECPGTISIIFSAVVKLVNLPSDIFPAGDVYNGVNFFNEILVTNT